MRSAKVIVTAVVVSLLAQAGAAQDCGPRHAAIVGRMADMKTDADVEVVAALVRAVIAGGCGEVRDYLFLRKAALQRGDASLAADLSRRAMTAPDADAANADLALYAAADLARLGKSDQARSLLQSPAAVSRFREEWLTLSRNATIWRRVDPALPADLLAAAEVFDAESEMGARYRRAAAVTALERGFLHSVIGPDKAVLEFLALSAAALPLDQFDTGAQMTALRAESVAYAAEHHIPHAVAALEQLFDLCYPDEIRRPCPEPGYAKVALQTLGGPGSDDVQLLVDYDNFRVAGYVANAAFSWISWDEHSTRRPTAKAEDFRGLLTAEGRPYGGEVDPEEDRETIQDLLLTLREDPSLLEAAARRPEILVKSYLVELAFTLQFGMLPLTPIVRESAFIGKPIEEVEAIVDRPHALGCVSAPTWEAFDAARRERLLFRRQYQARVPDRPSERVWQLYHDSLSRYRIR
jgi:hypothetical protein